MEQLDVQTERVPIDVGRFVDQFERVLRTGDGNCWYAFAALKRWKEDQDLDALSRFRCAKLVREFRRGDAWD